MAIMSDVPEQGRAMHIGVIGAAGTIGSRVVTEALARGHRVAAFSRDAARIREGRENIDWRSVDVLDAGSIAAVLPGLDVLISGYQPGNAAQDMADTLRRSIADPTVYATAARALLKALESHPRTRLIVIGGAGSLEAEPGLVRADSDELLHDTLDGVGLPREYAAAVRGHRDALNVLRTSNRLWTYFSPAESIAPGERTGRFRIGGDQPVLDADGRSHISAEDAAVALVDEVELPRFVQRRFTIGY
ncbi:NAD(P)-dependent oxidoreductase [Kitasatospora sp. NPDC058406]|uniref:NAD(P)-dependent oxidoreductase n=1 Tax=Kitasatospora sp. NPDC058406 TaxID=3346483 RepID=UPI003658282C